jgi:phage baseplate assembly protein W
MADSMDDRTFLGRGWSFPPEFDLSRGRVIMVSEEEDIAESLYVILSTIPGERVMFPRFGCGIHKMVFEEMSVTLITQLKEIIYKSILNFEPRIKLNSVSVGSSDPLDGILQITIDYTVRKTNSRNNMVYPFYLREGTNVPRFLFNPEPTT